MSRASLAVALTASLAGCGGPVPTTTIRISAAGISPPAVEVMAGTCVSFENVDAAEHDVAAVDASACPQLGEALRLAPGATSRTCSWMGPATCAFHDPSRAAAAAPDPFAGTIQVEGAMDGMPSM